MAEAVGCPEDMTTTGSVCASGIDGQTCVDTTPPIELHICESQPLRAWMKASDNQNNQLFVSEVTFSVYEWQSLNMWCASFPSPTLGTLKADDTQCSSQTVRGLNPFVSSTTGTFSVSYHPDAYLSVTAQGSNIDPNNPVIDVGETIWLIDFPYGIDLSVCTDSTDTTWSETYGGAYINLDQTTGEVTGAVWSSSCPGGVCTGGVGASWRCSCDGDPADGQWLEGTIDIGVLEPDVVVDARYAGCEWDADYCYVPNLASTPTAVEVRAGLRTRSDDLEWKEGVNLTIYGDASPSYAVTDASGLFVAEGTTIDWTEPFAWVEVTAHYGGGTEDTSIWAATDDICYDFPYPPEPTCIEAHGALVQEPTEWGGGSVFSSDLSVLPTVGSVSASVSCSAQPSQCGNEPWVSVSQQFYWWDTVVVIPHNLRLLDTMRFSGKQALFSVSSNVSGSATGASSPSSAAYGSSTYWLQNALEGNWIARAQYSDDNPPIEETPPIVQLGSSYSKLGEVLWVKVWGAVGCTAGADYWTDEYGCHSDSASGEVNASNTVLGISDMLVYNPATLQYESLDDHGGYWLFSCSGVFTQGR